MMAGLLKLVHDSCLFIGPILLKDIINYLNEKETNLKKGLTYVFYLFLSQLAMSLCLRQYFWWCFRVGMRLRSAVVTGVYNKSLLLSLSVAKKKSIGQITNLMSVDSTRLQDLTPYLHAIWYSFFQIIIALYFLWKQVGISCLGGVAVIILTIPFTGRISGHLKTIQKALSKLRDERIKLTNEVLNGIRVIKLQSWEKEFMKRILQVRENELKELKRYVIMQSISGNKPDII
jgi:ABC-type multidrug transport system fused ATPase/permease subunit